MRSEPGRPRDPALEAQGVKKVFPRGVHALWGLELAVAASLVGALCGLGLPEVQDKMAESIREPIESTGRP